MPKSIVKKVVSVDGVAVTAEGRGAAATPVLRGQDVTYLIVVTGAPPGQSGKKGQVTDILPQDFHFLSAEPAAAYDGKKLTWDNVAFEEDGQLVLRVSLRVGAVAPCNHVATNVAHVNGIGSDQAQVRIVCPADGAGAAAEKATGKASSDDKGKYTVEKSVEFEGQPLTRLDSRHLGKKVTYNILVRRSGDINEKTRLRITEDLGEMCGNLLGLRNPDGSLNNENVEITAEQGRVGTEITVNDNCVITILGDAKKVVGNRFHIKVRIAPVITAGTRLLTNRCTVQEEGSDEAPATAVLGVTVAPELTALPPATPPASPAEAAPPAPAPAAPASQDVAPAAVQASASPAPASTGTSGAAMPAALPRAGDGGLPGSLPGITGLLLAALGFILRRIRLG